MKLLFHDYRYYPYEKQLALREAAALLGNHEIRELSNGLELLGCPNSETASRLVYFSQINNGQVAADTIQAKLERAASAGKKRQATRYSVHGLHEYKGKFNPQICKAILNVFGVGRGDRVLDPFCGSGTTLIECVQLGAEATGIDLNPLAVFIANAKLQALATPAEDLNKQFSHIEKSLKRRAWWPSRSLGTERETYLRKWFDAGMLSCIELAKEKIEAYAPTCAPVFLCIASNLLREYSLQDPNDLRIRRRTSPLPTLPFNEAFVEACRTSLARIADAQIILGVDFPRADAQLGDITSLANVDTLDRFDAALTSPPYAMALPYVDTQRLSLVWLGLLEPDQILPLEAALTGSREMRGNGRSTLSARFGQNADRLPDEQFEFCSLLKRRLTAEDGFRRKAVPALLYRYFANMQMAFGKIRKQLKARAPFALIVGHNHTVLGGVRLDIDTPRHLASVGTHAGWRVEEIIELQTYHRYGYHLDNAVSAENLVLLRNR
jgi:SAM-dependent methyltransferase